MTGHFAFALLALAQQPLEPQTSAIARVDVTPATAEIQVGQTIQLNARALDAAGQPVNDAVLDWFTPSDEGSVDSTGRVTGGYAGFVRVAAVAWLPGAHGQRFGFALVHVLPEAPARIEVAPAPAKMLVGTRLTLVGTAYSKHADRRYDLVSFTSSNPRVARVTADGRLHAVAPGGATITAKAGPAAATLPLQVLPNTVARLAVEPASISVRTGDVVRFMTSAKDADGRAVRGMPLEWAIDAAAGVAQIDDAGAFVAETPGTYTVSARLGSHTADAVVQVEPRRVTRGIAVLAHLPLMFRTAEAWVHPSGKCVYVTTFADRVYAIDIADVTRPRIVDSMMTNARVVNDVMTTEDGGYGVFTREGASDRKNGIVVFAAGDPCHPTPVSEYSETVTGGVHSSYVYRGRAYITDDATGSLRIIDIRDPHHPKEIARWEAQQTEAGRYLHDLMVVDGLAYLAYWNDGLIILDVGNGMRGGSPEHPQFVAQLKYDLNATYARVERLWGPGFVRGTHTAWRAGRYVFVGDEVYPARPYRGLSDGNNLVFGRLHVVDVSDIEHPKEVAWYEPPDGGVHNLWVVGDTLYLGDYQGGARVLDISGELKGDLLRQGREISWILTADSSGQRPHTPLAWGAIVRDGNIFVPDMNSGLWILRLERPQEDSP